MTSAVLALYAVIVLGFGYVVSVRLLRETNALAVAGFTAILGLALYMILANALGYIMPIKSAFTVTLVLMATVEILALCLTPKKTSAWITPPRAVVVILGGLALFVGFTHLRIWPGDFMSWGQGPLTATIAEGNFPPHGAFAPWGRLRYHYGPEMLSSSLVSLAGLEPLDAYAPQPLLAAFGVLFLVAALVYGWTKSWRTSALAGVLAMCGGGWIWFNVTDLISDLYHNFILGEKIAGPFRALSFMGNSPIANPIAIWFAHRSTCLGFAFLYALLYASYQATETKKGVRVLWVLVSIVFGAALALTMETGLLVFGAATAAFLGCFLLSCLAERSPLSAWTVTTVVLVVILGTTGIIALFQGGILSPFGGGTSVGMIRPYLTTYFDPWGARRIYVGEWMFIRDFGLPLLLMPVTAWFCFKKRNVQPWYGLVFFIGLAYTCVPIFTKFSPRHYETLRLFWGATSVSSLLIGIMMSEWILASTSLWKRGIGWLAIASMLVCSAVWLGMTAIFPDHHFKASPLFIGMDQLPALAPGSDMMFIWVKANTGPKDYFYIRPSHEQAFFTTMTGRTAIGPRMGDDFPVAKLRLASDFESSCSPVTFRELGAKYLVTMTLKRTDWFRLKCRPAEWKIVYDGSTPASPVPIVYTPR